MTLKGTKTSVKPPKQDFGGFDMRSTIQTPSPRIPYQEIAQVVLGDQYDLSLVICGDKLARTINKTYRPAAAKKPENYSPNVLSFPLNKSSGEIFLNIRKAEREAREMNISARSRLAHLYVHGCFHLLGMDHSDEMEHREDIILSRFKLI